ncbi:hypothetical protein GA0061101_11089 [Rhizobium lusitanum]|uniref:Uncharacterized protein n=1 Tax=Rhizobium lusitanum TaxID=293958 RepID=A0A1C3WCI6_9HYPH|nr:hypothetical protein GA0061101_11089 [Rhizobium lusitanum]
MPLQLLSGLARNADANKSLIFADDRHVDIRKESGFGLFAQFVAFCEEGLRLDYATIVIGVRALKPDQASAGQGMQHYGAVTLEYDPYC